MSDYGTLIERIKDELKRSDLETQIKRAIISSLAFYSRQRFTWNTARATLPTQPDQEFYQLPSDFIEADTMVLRRGSELDFLDEVTHHWLDREKEWDGYRSRPCVFSIQTNEVRLYPTPDATYTLLMSYVYEHQNVSLSASPTAANAWMTKGEELVRLHAKVDMFENVIRGPEAMAEASLLRQREMEVYRDLRRQFKRGVSSGRIMPWT